MEEIIEGLIEAAVFLPDLFSKNKDEKEDMKMEGDK